MGETELDEAEERGGQGAGLWEQQSSLGRSVETIIVHSEVELAENPMRKAEQEQEKDQSGGEEGGAEKVELGSGEAGLTPAQVTHTRQARGPGELSLHQGDIVFLHRRLAPGWFLAELQGVLGLAPASFIQLVAGGAAPAQARATQPYTARGPGEV